MTTTISSNKISPSSNQKAGHSGDNRVGQISKAGVEARSAASPSIKPGPATEDTVDVGRASHLYHNAEIQLSETGGKIDSPELAAELAANIRGQIEGNGGLAMSAQAGTIPDHIGTLLSTSP